MRSLAILALFVLVGLPRAAAAQVWCTAVEVSVPKSDGRVVVEATVENRGSTEARGNVVLTLQPDGSTRGRMEHRRAATLSAGARRKFRFATRLVAGAAPEGNTCRARVPSGEWLVYRASGRFVPEEPEEAAIPAKPAPSPSASPSPGLLVITSRRFENGKTNGEIVARITVRNDGGRPMAAKVKILFRDLRGGALDRSGAIDPVPPGEKRDLVIRTGLRSPDRIDTSGGSVHIRNIDVVRPAPPARVTLDPSGRYVVYEYYAPDIRITEGWYSIEVQLEQSPSTRER